MGSNRTRFTPEADEYLKANYTKFTSKELSQMLFSLFGISVATQTVTERLLKLGIRRGSNFIFENHVPKQFQTCKPIGTERIEKGRTVMVKIAQPNVWITKAQAIMGFDPRTHQPIFLDGNSLNVSPDNIVVVSKRTHARLAKNGWLNSSKDVLLTGVKWSELLYAINEVV